MANPPSTNGRTRASIPDRLAKAIPYAAAVGLVAALVGFIDGIVMMAGRMVTDCPGGTFFPLGTTDFNCYTHPHGAEGLAISAISLSLGALSLLAYCIAVATSKDRMASPSV